MYMDESQRKALEDHLGVSLPADVLGLAQFGQVVYFSGSPEHPQANVLLSAPTEEPPFAYWMAAVEMFMGTVAKKSPQGFEKALELLMAGAMSYRVTDIRDNEQAVDGPNCKVADVLDSLPPSVNDLEVLQKFVDHFNLGSMFAGWLRRGGHIEGL